jgi:PAS domain S-box-containing protein
MPSFVKGFLLLLLAFAAGGFALAARVLDWIARLLRDLIPKKTPVGRSDDAGNPTALNAQVIGAELGLPVTPVAEGDRGSLEAELRLQKSEARELSAILDTATDGVAVLDSQGRILTLNRSGEALFGYDQNDVVGEPFTNLIASESRVLAKDYLEGLKSDGVVSLLNQGREIIGLARQGGKIPIFMTLGRIGAGGGADQPRDIRFCALLRDLTHWKKVEGDLEGARKEAERASALKSDFLAKVSHEIRTPLNAILGFAEVMMEERFGPIGNERYKAYLKDIHSSGALVMSLVNDLLDLSKIEAGKLDLDFASIDANRIVSECVSIMQPQANGAAVALKLSVSPALPNILADERSLRQIVLNLLSNAIKFNRPGGQVVVATALADAGNAVIRIRDTGIGMSEAEIGVAFEPFRQLAPSSGGTGLGLPLTKALVEANHAVFSIKSKKHEGTLVEVAFPPARVLAE